jgi:alpha-tubulin suppressor-like RCC1 family protein
VLASGAINCWGDNGNGQLGNESTSPSTTPVAVTGIGNAAEVSVGDGDDHTCAMLTTGGAACWGSGTEGQLGNGGVANSSVPVSVTGF